MNKTKILLLALFLILAIFVMSCTGQIDTSTNNSTIMTLSKIRKLEAVCNEISSKWAGSYIRYSDPDYFLDECSMITFKNDMDMVRKIRSIVPDGHFYIGLNETHPENKFDEAKVIPLVVTEDKNNNVVIAKSTNKLRKMGLKEGNIILKIDDIEVIYYIEKLMKLLPQSTYFESKEKAYRLLFSTILYAKNVDEWDVYFELDILNGDYVYIEYLDITTGEINDVKVEFELLKDNISDDILSIVADCYWSIQNYYDVPKEDVCTSKNEFLTLKEIDGEKWLIYHPLDFMFESRKYEDILNNYECLNKYVDKADYFILDLRDTMGGYSSNTLILMGIINAMKGFSLGFNSGREDMMPYQIKGLKTVPKNVPVYVWTNSICGSSCDIFVYGVKKSQSKHISIIGKPTAGRVQSVVPERFLNLDITMPVGIIYDENGIQLEGRPIMPNYYFDVDASDYENPDKVLLSFINYIKKIKINY